MNTNQELESYKKARKQVDAIKGFYGNLISYIIANSILIFLNLKYSPDHFWALYPLLGWGIGVLFHGFEAFGSFPFFNNQWEEKKIKQFMEEEKNSNQFKNQ